MGRLGTYSGRHITILRAGSLTGATPDYPG